ncbi:hypothetical protein [Haloarchaeobius sp. TZWWS8]|uniref:hypothetical protein n=1 Tax=Haloarchaeobius sp. TZWWS8 TaxID=3446121 RepID=UPI003EC0F9B5
MLTLPVESARARTLVERAMDAYEPIERVAERDSRLCGRTRRLNQNHEVVVDFGSSEWGADGETVVAVFVRASAGYAETVPTDRYREEFLETLGTLVDEPIRS